MLHFGLYFTPEHVERARKDREREPFKSAWSLLDQPPASPLDALLLNAFRYRFADDTAAGEAVIMDLQAWVSQSLDVYPAYWEALAGTIALAQGYEMTRDQAAWGDGTAWRDAYQQVVETLNILPGELSLVETIWLGLLNLVSGVVLEDEMRLEQGVATFRQIIATEVRPEGYLPRVVDGRDGGSLERDLLAVAGLVLLAEAGRCAGLDLWGYESRGISVHTAAAYLTYYAYYPDQWRWDADQTEIARRAFKEQGGFLEMVYRRTQPHDLKLMLEERRPFFHPLFGGLTTLSHGVTARKGLFR